MIQKTLKCCKRILHSNAFWWLIFRIVNLYLEMLAYI